MPLFCDRLVTVHDDLVILENSAAALILPPDELTKARVQLTRLKEEENRLIQQLLSVRAEISLQNNKISSLIELRRPAIHLLSTEALVSIFDLVIHDNSGYTSLGKRKQRLACVSRQWRDLILDTPALWSTIVVTEQHSIFTETCLKKSRETQLDIVVTSISPALNVVLSCTHRWRSLLLIGDKSLGDKFVKKARDLVFPTLRRVIIPSLKTTFYPKFLFSVRAPALEHLQVGGHFAWNDFCPPITLKSLDLTFFKSSDYGYSFPYLIPTHTLTRLSLSGPIDNWALRSDSIPFPHLKTLMLHVNKINMFLKAIMAPNLESFVYSSPSDDPLKLFGDLDGKFGSVHFLCFSNVDFKTVDDTTDAEALCRAFPHVRHVELDTGCVLQLFTPRWPCGEFRTDLWSDLESLTLRGPRDSWHGDLQLLWSWLAARRNVYSCFTRVKVTNIEAGSPDNTLPQYFYHSYCTLKGICTLELEILPVTFKAKILVGHDSSSTLVSALSCLRFCGIYYYNLVAFL